MSIIYDCKFILMQFLIVIDLIMLALGVSFNSNLHIHDGWIVCQKMSAYSWNLSLFSYVPVMV